MLFWFARKCHDNIEAVKFCLLRELTIKDCLIECKKSFFKNLSSFTMKNIILSKHLFKKHFRPYIPMKHIKTQHIANQNVYTPKNLNQNSWN